ncbi:restriction endonuclease subunit S [Thalassobaculum sp.]|uniref:restriction endonuclease subunit S n=1 Tax=Thalassobaculum sp. TaxID=2022740 RepID=UPI003B5CF097
MSTEVPEGWCDLAIGDWAKPVKRWVGEAKAPVLSMTKHSGFVRQAEYFSRNVHSQDTSKYKIVRKGDFAYATIHLDEGSIDYLRNIEVGAISPMYTVFEVDSNFVDRDFVFAALKRLALAGKFNSLSSGGVNRRKSINFKDLQKYHLPLPPLPEQRKIAEILTSVDGAIQATEAVIEQTKKVKQGVMDRLLTKGIGHTRFKQTEIGEIPEEWEVGPLCDVISPPSAGVSVNAHSDPAGAGELGVLKTSAVSGGGFKVSENKRVDLAAEIERLATPVESDTVIINRKNTPALVGASAYIRQGSENIFLSDLLWSFRSKKESVKTEWIGLNVNRLYKSGAIRSLASGTSASMSNISKKAFLTIEMPIPPIGEQTEIIDKSQVFDRRIFHLDENKSLLLKLKSALMADLLTGRKRVAV